MRSTTTRYNLTPEQTATIEAAILANPGANILDIADAANLPVTKLNMYLHLHPRGRDFARQNYVAANERGRRPFWWSLGMPIKPRRFSNPFFMLPVPTTGSAVLATIVNSFNEQVIEVARRVSYPGRKHLQKIVSMQRENVAMIGVRDKIIEASKKRIYQLEGEKVTLENTLRDFQDVIALNTELLKRGNQLLLIQS